MNVHDEAKYLARTLRSTEEAVRFAAFRGALSELIVVLDRPTAGVIDFIDRYEFDAFDGHKVIVCDNGSLGPSRNIGISHASGTYVTTCDADDLISFNTFDEMLMTACHGDPRVVLVPQYLFVFGVEYYVVEYFDSNRVTPLMFTGYQPYHSRLFAHRSVFADVPYAAAHPGSGYVYEDWHYNCQLLARGYQFDVVPDTILFCRRRRHSLLASSNQTTGPQIPPSALFAPETYLPICASAMEIYSRQDHPSFGSIPPPPVRPGGSEILCADPVIAELIAAVNAVDPAIDAGILRTSPLYNNLANSLHPGATYYRLCERAGSIPFGDVVLLPRATPVSELDYVRAVVNSILTRDPQSRALVLSWKPEGTADDVLVEFAGRMPNVVQADLHEIEPNLRDTDAESVIVKALQSLAPAARVHIIPAHATMAFVSKFLGFLGDWQLIVYRFGQAMREIGGRRLNAGTVFDFISDCLEKISLILVPDRATLQADCERLMVSSDRWHELPPPIKGDPVEPDRLSYRLISLPQSDPTDNHSALTLLQESRVHGSAMTEIKLVLMQTWADLEDTDLGAFDALVCPDWDGPGPGWALRAIGRGIPVIAPRNRWTTALFPVHLQELLFEPGVEFSASPAPVLGRSCATVIHELYAQPAKLRAARAATRAFGQSQCAETAFRRRVYSVVDKLQWTR